MMSFLLLAIPMMILAALSGGTFPGSKIFDKEIVLFKKFPIRFTWVPEALFCLFITAAAEMVLGRWFPERSSLIAAVSFIVSFLGMQTATGPALPWGDNPELSMSRPRTISPVVNFISDALGFQRGDINYCRTWMALKGFIIGLPIGGLPLAVLWPLAYDLGHRAKPHVNFDSHLIKEMLSGLAAAIAISLFLAAFN